jgi:hypothetical protein
MPRKAGSAHEASPARIRIHAHAALPSRWKNEPGSRRRAQAKEIDMQNETPQEGQDVQVKMGSNWQAATYRRGQFVDVYGLPLDSQRISEWQAMEPRAQAPRDTLAEWNKLRRSH